MADGLGAMPSHEGGLHVGPIDGDTLGRADARPMRVPEGSYVIPAVVVSHLGEGNTIAGYRILDEMFGPATVGRFAKGGSAPEGVPIYAADGEVVLSPDQVARIGGGDIKKGHEVLDEFVKMQLAKAAKTIRKLPGPVKR